MSQFAGAVARFNRAISYVHRRLGRGAYVLLAVMFSVLIVVDLYYTQVIVVMERKTYDLMMRNRVNAARPDSGIVIIDIDERSLAAMAADYGRWPWPRQVLAELVEGIEQQQPAAIVFDILFSDPDVNNPGSEAYFNRAMAATRNTYFPYLRLDPRNDALSQVKPSMLPGVRRLPDAEAKDTGIAVVLPRYPAIIESGRIGLHNIEPDRDSVIRRYRPWRDEHGWRLPSVPLMVAAGLGWPLPAEESFLINWRGGPFIFKFVSFSDVYEDTLRQEKKRPQDEFKGKIVFIGSTAPSLFDIKATPMASIHPGVEILATATDNLRHGDYYIEQSRNLYAVLSLLFVWGLAAAFLLRVRSNLLGPAFVVLQGGLIAGTFFTLSLTTLYIDLTAPFTFGLLFFTTANIFALLSERMLTLNGLLPETLEPSHDYVLSVLTLRLDQRGHRASRRFQEKVGQMVISSPCGAHRVARLVDGGGALEEMFRDTAVIYWLVPAAQAGIAGEHASDAERICVELSKHRARVRSRLCSGTVTTGPRGKLGQDARKLLLDALAGLPERDA
jgi:CHASE2 domain-containing sensor protein